MRTTVSGSTASTSPSSTAHLPTAIVAWPHIVEYPSLWHEEHSQVGVRVVRLHRYDAIHVVVSAGLQHQQPPQVVVGLSRGASLVEDGGTGQAGIPTRHDTHGLTPRVHLPGPNEDPVGRRHARRLDG